MGRGRQHEPRPLHPVRGSALRKVGDTVTIALFTPDRHRPVPVLRSKLSRWYASLRSKPEAR